LIFAPFNILYIETVLINDDEGVFLFSRRFTSWDECERFLNEWAKSQDFHLIKDHVTRNEGVIRRRTFICDYGRTYKSNSNIPLQRS
jgi:hypothetical protein